MIRDVPVFVAGGIGRGEAMLGYLEMGASGVPARHALRLRHRIRSPIRNFKQAFIRAAARDAMPSVAARPALSGDPGARARQ